jgi:hypothetical protein
LEDRSVKFAKSVVLPALATSLVPVTAAADTFEVPASVIQEVNVTSDSSPGWVPTADQRQQALRTVQTFLGAVDSGRYDEAYRLLDDLNRRNQTHTQFADEAKKFNSLAGAVKFWRVLRVAWTKDPANGPMQGVYAAIDLASQFVNVDRDCGYIVLYQRPRGGDFTVIRRENNYLDNASALRIENEKAKAVVDSLWGQLSRNCPNYVPPLPEAKQSTIGYATVAAALEDLRSRPSVAFTTVNGWTIATDNSSSTVWSFAPAGYPAYPAVVKRWVVSEGGGAVLRMAVHCEASKAACDELVLTFGKMNAQLPRGR